MAFQFPAIKIGLLLEGWLLGIINDAYKLIMREININMQNGL